MGKAQKRKVKEQKRQLQKQDRRRGRVAAALAASDNPATSKLARKPREQRQHGRSGQQQSASRSGIGRAAVRINLLCIPTCWMLPWDDDLPRESGTSFRIA